MISGLNILLSNDDGLSANGLLHLEQTLRRFAEVWAVAPDRERSGSSQAISIREHMRLERVRERHYTLSGFPVDCVNVALHSDLFPPFDLVVSGINHGVNLGDDIHYSGTVGAARHAAIHGVRAVAVSCPIREREGDFNRVSRWLAGWLQENYIYLLPGVVYNINYPEEASDVETSDPYPPVEITKQGSRIYNDEFEMGEEGEGRYLLRMKESAMGHIEEEGSDFHAHHMGRISITPIGLNTTDANEWMKWLPKSRNERS